jgi:diguanylate cyclase
MKRKARRVTDSKAGKKGTRPTVRKMDQDLTRNELLTEVNRLRARVKEMQTELLIDDLTGLYNARYLKQRIERALIAMRENRQSPALLFIDVDYFKSINELHGHQTGGEMLNQVGRIISRVIRVDDIAFRYGGDEFVVLVNGGMDGGRAVGERLRQSVEAAEFQVSGIHGAALVKLTVSVGLRVIRPEDTARTILDEADKAMFQAKRNARNTLVAA